MNFNERRTARVARASSLRCQRNASETHALLLKNSLPPIAQRKLLERRRLREGRCREIEQVEQGLEDIRSFYREHSRSELIEQSGELQSLESWLTEIRANKPLSAREKLERALSEAVKREDYEKAARVRDALRDLKTEK